MTTADSKEKTQRAAYLKQWRAANKDRINAYAAARYAADREARRAKMRANYRKRSAEYKVRAIAWAQANKKRRYEIVEKYRRENRELYREAGRRDYERNKEAWRARSKAFRAEHPELMRALRDAWKERNPEACAHHVGLRRTRKLQATPAWADLDAIKTIYAEAARLRRETGEDWHVDHEIPLTHPLVCGLHVYTNLRVIPAAVNQSKGNKLESAQ